MKKLFFLLTAVTLSVLSYSQMTVSDVPKKEVVGEFASLGTSYAEITKNGEVCTLIYRDEKFATVDNYKSFSFRATDLDALYALFTDFSSVSAGDEKSVDLEDGGLLRFKYGKMVGKMYAEVFHISKAGVLGQLRWMNDKQAKKLFGK